ncbi:MAG: tol-pal system protein YbgF [Burkholderiaceae bacterium]|nr:tol-pal system protein YbgF [Burkholderiaceae bacterium]
MQALRYQYRQLLRTAGLAVALGAIALSVLTPTSAWALFEDDEARKAVLELRTESRASTKEMNRAIEQMKARFEKQFDDMAKHLDRIEATARGQLELQAQLDALRQELATLRGRVEVQTNELTQTQRQQRETFAAIDERLQRFEPKQVTIDGQTFKVEQAERRSFEAALGMFRAGDFKAALGAFQQFQSAYPESPYAPSAAFWVGSSQFALKDYKAAIATHQALIALAPDGPRAPDATLNLGFAQLADGDTKAGRSTLEGLVARFPAAPAARAARERLMALPPDKPARVDRKKTGR